MNKIDYSDLYKFLASIGVGFLALAVWIFLKEPLHSLADLRHLKNLDPEIEKILAARMDSMIWFSQNVERVSAFCFVIGVTLVVWGLWKWIPQQGLRDQLERIIYKKTCLELELMSPGAIETKVAAEVQDQESEVDAQFRMTVSEPFAPSSAEHFRKYIVVEEQLAKRIRDCFGSASKSYRMCV